MDPNNNDPQNIVSVEDKSSLQSELAHATEEMYKKNVELNERNKTLSLLRKIDEIVLSTVTDPHQIAQQVARVIVTESDFKGLVVYELKIKSKSLYPLADAYSGAEQDAKLHAEELQLTTFNNVLVKAVNERKSLMVNNLSDIVEQDIIKQELAVLQRSAEITTIIALPLVVRNIVIGAIAVMLGENYQTLSQSQKDLIQRLTGVIGIALDNALLYQAIQDANIKLQELDKIKDEFVSLASHELRTPMTVIKSYIWLILEDKVGVLDPKHKVYLDRAYQSVSRLIDMVNDMLNISRIESGRFTIEPKPTNLTELIEEVVSEMQTRASEQGLHLVGNVAQNMPVINIDRDRIKQVLINLIGNSLKFTPREGRIIVTSERQDKVILTTIRDTGMGIKAEDMEKLFKKFNMLGSGMLTKQAGQGSGLGLYLSKNLIELHHGRIWVESEGDGKGSTFSFTLPV